MSGPKSLSCRVFNQKLNDIFKLQFKAEKLYKKLVSLEISDEKKNIQIDCKNFTRKIKIFNNAILKAFKPEYKGDIKESRLIERKIKKLKGFIDKLENEKGNFINKKQSYKSYLSYESYIKNSINLFNNFKKNTISFFISVIKNNHSAPIIKSIAEINSIKPIIKKSNFSNNFKSSLKVEKEKIDKIIDIEMKNINKIRIKILDNILENIEIKDKNLNKTNSIEDKQIQNIKKKINSFLLEIEDPNRIKKYMQKFTKLKKSEVFKDIFYYKEFFDHIVESEKFQKMKFEIKEILIKLHKENILTEFENEKNELIQLILDTLNKKKIKQNHIENINLNYNLLNEKNYEKISENNLIEKQSIYIKQQLIDSLKKLNYKVLTNTTLIDFEKNNDFLFSIPKQNNYLNLRFNNNDLLYSFVIEEDKDSLSIEETDKKFQEMETSCSDFKEVIEMLSLNGIHFEIEKDIKISENAILQIPDKYKDKISKVRKRNEEIKLKKKKRSL